MSKIIEELEQAQMGKDVPEFGPGDTIEPQPVRNNVTRIATPYGTQTAG